ncbi:hypothetical protein QAD02_008042 [Eretmocerus hayati]|uniref:Uncharacterized protein n=1 Tax=Eretmocerus hayati TaxID=131215 RepID=A0ACC2N5B9_9HYME|nr:hypothetical protein QAD02_008042 [Eretmocerus hayati]
MDPTENQSSDDLVRERKYLQPALVRWQVSEETPNDEHIHRIDKDLYQMEELDIESIDHEKSYDCLMAKSHDLEKEQNILTRKSQDISEALTSTYCSIDKTMTILQTIKSDYDNLYNRMKLQSESHKHEEEKLPCLESIRKWSEMKRELATVLHNTELKLEKLNGILKTNK